MDFEVDRPPPAELLQEIFDHHGKGNSNYIKKSFEKVKKVKHIRISLIDLTVMKTLSTARLPVTVSSVQTWS